MKQNKRISIVSVTVLAAAAGFAMRLAQLRSMAAGSVSAGVSWALGLLCVVLAVGLVIACRGLDKRAGYEESFSSGLAEMLVSAAAAVLVLLSSALGLLDRPHGAELAMGFFGILSGLCIAVTAAQRYRGVVPGLAFHAIPCLYLVVRLILDFKAWSVDPAVLDYCYALFAAITAMCATYHLGAFCLDRGQRRISVFWCLLCVLFSAISLAGGGASHRLLMGGLLLWTGANAWELLED